MSGSCYSCTKEFTAASKPQQCMKCFNIYHTTCTKLTSVRDSNDKTIKICGPCLADANTAGGRSRTSSVGSSSNYSNVSKTPGNSRPSTPATLAPSNDLLTALISKIDKIDSTITTMGSQMNALVTGFNSLETKMLDLSTTLNLRIDAGEQRLDQLQQDHLNLQAKVDSLMATTTNNAEPSLSLDNLQLLDDANRKLTAKVSQLALQQERMEHASKIVLSGILPTEFGNLQLAASAVFQSMNATITDGDILSVRPLRKPPTVTSQTGPSTTTTPDTVTPSTHIVPLLVTFKSANVARAAITAKIRIRKFHTSQICPTLLSKALPTGQITPALINVNEFLPPALHQLKLRVLERSRDKQYNFLTFIRNGNIYARRRKHDSPHLITSEDDLNAFLTAIDSLRNIPTTNDN